MITLSRNLINASRVLPTLYRFSSDKNEAWKTQTPQQIKTSQIIAKNSGLVKYITRTYNTTALTLVGSLSTAYGALHIPLLLANPGATMIAGFIASIGGLIGTSMVKPKQITEHEFGVPVHRTQNSPLRLGLYGLFTVGLGLSAAPLFGMAAFLNPTIIPTAIGVTSGIFGGASLVAYNMPKDKMLGYGRIFMGSLLGLIAMQLVGLGASLIMGPNPLSLMLFKADTYLGILLFSGFIAYDTHVAIKAYEQGNADHIGTSIQFVLDFWNILIRVIQIFMDRE